MKNTLDSKPQIDFSITRPLSTEERKELDEFRKRNCTHGFLPGQHTQGIVGCEKCCGRTVYIWENVDHNHTVTISPPRDLSK